jgi:hypothetical protein
VGKGTMVCLLPLEVPLNSGSRQREHRICQVELNRDLI